MKFLIISIISSTLSVASCDTNSLLIRNHEDLVANKKLIQGGDEWLSDNVQKLKEKADKIVVDPIYSIVEKSSLPDSKDKHDYYSIATYYWPNPKTKNGLPYIHKDGVANPDRLKIKDYSYLLRLGREINTLSLAYFYTDDQKYADKASLLLKTWFIDPATKMNPNLNHAQAIPGKNSGRVEGIIDSRVFVDVIDAVELLKQSNGIAQDDYDKLKLWFSDYLNWLTESQLGKQAYILKNNIGTAYAMQVLAFSIFSGKDITAVTYLETQIPQLIENQLDPDGKQPLELRRSRGWDYSISNLTYWFKIASMAERYNYDLWNYMTPSGKSLNVAYNWLNRFTSGEEKWEAKQILEVDKGESFLPLEMTAGNKFIDAREIQRSETPRRNSSRSRTGDRVSTRSMTSSNISMSDRKMDIRERQRKASLSPEQVLSVQY